MSAIEDLNTLVKRLAQLCDAGDSGARSHALYAQYRWRSRAERVKISVESRSYGENTTAEDAAAAAAVKAEFVARFDAQGRQEATKALEAVRAEILAIRMRLPSMVAAAFAEAQDVASALAVEIVERSK